MKQKQLEQSLRRAAEHAAPEYSDRLGEAAGRLHAAPSPARPRQSRTLVRSIAAVAACAVLLLGCMGILSHNRANRVKAVVELDVNPSIQLSINHEERVLSVDARNEDALRVLSGMDLTGVQLDVALNALIGSLLRCGYISELANSILISVEGGESAAALQQRLSSEIDALLAGFGVEGSVLSQTLSMDEEIAALAAAHDISRGKAALICELLHKNAALRAEDLAGLTIHALNLLLDGNESPQVIARTGAASDGGYIGADAAKAAALAHAGIAMEKAAAWSVEMDVERGRMVYEVDFTADGWEYEYAIDAVTGDVVKSDRERDDDHAAAGGTVPSASDRDIGEEQALSAALAHAGIAAQQAKAVSVHADTDDGRRVYEIAFRAGEYKYEYEIDAATGDILEQDADREDRPDDGLENQSDSADAHDIGRDRAQRIALEHAGLSSGDNMRAERDCDDGVSVYEVEFVKDGVEYEYEINAATGQILGHSRESEHDDD